MNDQRPRLAVFRSFGVDLVSIRASAAPDFDPSRQVGPGGDTPGRRVSANTVHVTPMSEIISTVSPLETIDAEQLCELLHISMRTLKRWRQTGEGPAHVTTGRGYVYRTVTVLRWMEEREHVAQKAS